MSEFGLRVPNPKSWNDFLQFHHMDFKTLDLDNPQAATLAELHEVMKPQGVIDWTTNSPDTFVVGIYQRPVRQKFIGYVYAEILSVQRNSGDLKFATQQTANLPEEYEIVEINMATKRQRISDSSYIALGLEVMPRAIRNFLDHEKRFILEPTTFVLTRYVGNEDLSSDGVLFSKLGFKVGGLVNYNNPESDRKPDQAFVQRHRISPRS